MFKISSYPGCCLGVEIHLSEHALDRLEERIGGLNWRGIRVRDMDREQKIEFIKTELFENPLEITAVEKRELKLVTENLVAIVGLSKEIYLVKTVIANQYVSTLHFKVKDILNKSTMKKLNKIKQENESNSEDDLVA